jgi:TIR domain
MASTIQELVGLGKALDRFEERVKSYRKLLFETYVNHPRSGDVEQMAINRGEIDTIEGLIRRLAVRITGAEPLEVEWEPLHPYCSRNEDKKNGWALQNYEYFRWALMWLQKTRIYLDYLSGCQAAAGETRSSQVSQSDGVVEADVTYDVALSFAGEDRAHARQLAKLLREKGFSVFYDEYEQATLWGRNLYTHLSDVYQNKARYCLMFISVNYAQKLWTKRERESAQARAFRESREYILPLRLDDTVLPGLEDTVSYVDLRHTSHEEVLRLLTDKLRAEDK